MYVIIHTSSSHIHHHAKPLITNMDAVFALPEAPRADFLRSLIQSFGCSYVCLWKQHSHLSNRLFFLDGFYNGGNNQPSSSESLFHQYRTLTFDVSDECVPGVAFRNQLPYIHLKLLDLLPLTSTQIQTQFFLEAGIEMAVFMGCKVGEIELGFSNIPQVDIQTSLKNLFPEDFNVQSQSIHQHPHSSLPSSSFVPISTDRSNQRSSLLPNVPTTSHPNFPEALGVAPTQPSSHQNTIQPLSQVVPFPSHLPEPEREHDEIVRTLIRVLSSTSQQHQVLPHTSVIHPGVAAFTGSDMKNPNIKHHVETNFCRQNLQNTSLPFCKSLNSTRMRERNTVQATDHFSAQQHHFHVISERRRRERLKLSFEALRAVLPPETKKSKATILTTAKERIISLMADLEKLNMRKQQLMKDLSGSISEENKGRICDESWNVRVWHVSESSSSNSSEEKMVDLEVTMREQSCEVSVLIRILEFLERVQNVTLISTKTNIHTTEGGTTINELTFRLRIIEGNKWDERGFEEAIRRLVSDQIQCQLHQ